MNFCVSKRHCPLLESYKNSVGDEKVVLAREGHTISGKNSWKCHFVHHKPHIGWNGTAQTKPGNNFLGYGKWTSGCYSKEQPVDKDDRPKVFLAQTLCNCLNLWSHTRSEIWKMKWLYNTPENTSSNWMEINDGHGQFHHGQLPVNVAQ